MTMHIFVTGATGFLGSATVRELVSAGHRVLGLVRSDENAAALARMGGRALRGSLEDLDTLRRGAKEADAVIHTAFINDFSNFAHACAVDQRAISTIGEVLAGSDRPFAVTSGTPVVQGRAATEADDAVRTNPVSLLRAPGEDLDARAGGARCAVVGRPAAARGARADGARLAWRVRFAAPPTRA